MLPYIHTKEVRQPNSREGNRVELVHADPVLCHIDNVVRVAQMRIGDYLLLQEAAYW